MSLPAAAILSALVRHWADFVIILVRLAGIEILCSDRTGAFRRGNRLRGALLHLSCPHNLGRSAVLLRKST